MNKNKTALVTGASSGIGLEFTKLLAKDGYNLVLVARNKAGLDKVVEEMQKYNVEVKSIAKDLSVPSSAQEIYDELHNENISINVLINNAGFATYGLFIETDIQKELQELQVNIVTLTYLTKLFSRDMVTKGEGRILNVSSTAAFQPGPLMAVYYASKAYVLHFSEAIANELEGTGVTVTALCPGPTSTHFVQAAKMKESKVSKEFVTSASVVAEIGYKGMLQGKTVIVPGLRNRFGELLVKLRPRKMVISGVRKMQERK